MAEFEFRRSSYSGGQPDSQCVEVATNVPTAVAVRDSKEPTGSCIHLSPDAWTAFLAHCRRSEHRRQAERVRAYVEEHFLGGRTLTEEELAEARRAMAASRARAAARAAGRPE